VGNIDRAFKSRIHVALYYPKLNKDATYEIWKRNLKRIRADFKREGKAFIVEDKDILKYSKEHFKELRAAKFLNWNGRQIRNAFQTAIALAEYDAPKGESPVLNRKQFEKVAAASKDFDQYLKDTQRGKDDAQLAREEKVRVDEWNEFSPNARMIEEGFQWAPKTTRPFIPQPVQRRTSFAASKKKAKKGEVTANEDSEESDVSDVSEESEESEESGEIVSKSENDEIGSGAEVSMGAGHPSEDSAGVSSSEDEDDTPTPPLKTKTKSKPKDTSKPSASKGLETDKANLEDRKTVIKPKKKSKGSSSNAR
jgi:hypothetical protein